MKKLIALTLVLVLVAGCSAPTLKVGLGMASNVSIKAPSEKDGKEVNGTTQVDTTACAVAVDANGKIVNITWDCTQGKAAFDKTGTPKSEPASNIQTKRELGEGYGMKGISGIGKEWYEQIDALQTYSVGKTVADITGMATTKRDDAHIAVPAEDLKTGCTMTIEDFQLSLDKAAKNAK